jgi:thymidine kinase
VRPAIDSRYGDQDRIYSKEVGISAPAVPVDHTHPDEILRVVARLDAVKKVIVDEASFFSVASFLEVVKQLDQIGMEVVVGGLAYDANRNPWGPVLDLLTWKGVEETALTSLCDGDMGTCTTPAIWTYAKAVKKEVLEVGSNELYGASCDFHYSHLHVPNEI